MHRHGNDGFEKDQRSAESNSALGHGVVVLAVAYDLFNTGSVMPNDCVALTLVCGEPVVTRRTRAKDPLSAVSCQTAPNEHVDTVTQPP
jgi:hypothetical protein